MNGTYLVIGDLGTAKSFTNQNTEKTLTDSGTFGTPPYNAPEIIENNSYSDKIDIWSFGCVLYEMVKLEKLFNNKNEILDFDADKNFANKSIEPFFVTILKKYNFILNNQ